MLLAGQSPSDFGATEQDQDVIQPDNWIGDGEEDAQSDMTPQGQCIAV